MQKMLRASLIALVGGVLPAAALAQSCNTADRSVLLILDASGSMNAKLPNGETRIAVAQRAIKGVAGFVPAQAQLALRLYGAQSPAGQKNCQDTNLAVPFGAASSSDGAITMAVDGVKGDRSQEEDPLMIIVVSSGGWNRVTGVVRSVRKV